MYLFRFLLQLTLLQIVCNGKKSHYSVIWKTMNCQGNPLYVNEVSCIIHEPLRNQISVEISHVKELIGHFMEFRLYLERSNNKFRKAFSLIFNVCNEFKTGSSNTFANIAMATILRSSNHGVTCPIKGRTIFRNLTVGDNLPLFLPKNNFIMNLYFYYSKGPYISNFTIHGHFGDVS